MKPLDTHISQVKNSYFGGNNKYTDTWKSFSAHPRSIQGTGWDCGHRGRHDRSLSQPDLKESKTVNLWNYFLPSLVLRPESSAPLLHSVVLFVSRVKESEPRRSHCTHPMSTSFLPTTNAACSRKVCVCGFIFWTQWPEKVKETQKRFFFPPLKMMTAPWNLVHECLHLA